RDASRSDLVERWSAEVERRIESWPRGFLPVSRARVTYSFERIRPMLNADRLKDASWTGAHLRRLVDRMVDLLETVWMSDLASRTASRDSSAGVLTAASVLSTLGGDFDDVLRAPVASCATALIDEHPFETDLRKF